MFHEHGAAKIDNTLIHKKFYKVYRKLKYLVRYAYLIYIFDSCLTRHVIGIALVVFLVVLFYLVVLFSPTLVLMGKLSSYGPIKG